MNFDEWFYYQSRLIRVVLLVIPLVGWIVDILVRISSLIKNKCSTNIVGLIVFVLIGWAYLPTFIDALFLAITDRLMFCTVEVEE